MTGCMPTPTTPINVKAELELERLHRKIDRLYSDRVKDLLRLQREQMDLLRISWSAMGRIKKAK